jgi:hypothetical protein
VPAQGPLPGEEAFYLEYARSAARLMAVKQVAISNRQRLTFINNLVRDIGHNVIVPNMHFKLLFLQMEKQIERWGARSTPWRPSAPTPGPGNPPRTADALVKDLLTKQESISSRFQQSSLFLESLLRRSHFENGRYDLQLRPCKFKSQIFEPQLERFRPLLHAQGMAIRIAPDVRIDEDIVLEADLGLISQVFANLLANAVKYTAPMPGDSGREEKLVLYGWESMPDAFGPGTARHQALHLHHRQGNPPAGLVQALRRRFSLQRHGECRGLRPRPLLRQTDRRTAQGTGRLHLLGAHEHLPHNPAPPQHHPNITETGSCPSPS